MRNSILIFVGIAILLTGLLSLLDAIFDINAGRFVCPTLLILLGVWVLVRPRLLGPDTSFDVRLLGDTRRRGAWQVRNEEMWIIVGDARLDMTEAEIPVGETAIRIYGLVGDVTVTVPEDVGVSVVSTSVVTDARVFGQKVSRVFAPFHFTSEGYDAAERRLRLEVSRVASDIRIRRVAPEAA